MTTVLANIEMGKGEKKIRGYTKSTEGGEKISPTEVKGDRMMTKNKAARIQVENQVRCDQDKQAVREKKHITCLLKMKEGRAPNHSFTGNANKGNGYDSETDRRIIKLTKAVKTSKSRKWGKTPSRKRHHKGLPQKKAFGRKRLMVRLQRQLEGNKKRN